jgi:uncharacterized protein (TIGR04255 family)
MVERAHYPNAPITEALIDLRITHAQDFSVDDLGKMGEAIADRYPIQEPMYFHSGQLAFQQDEDPVQVETTHEHVGFRCISQNKQQILQARRDGFTFSILAPYDRWETFRDEARRLWELYRSAAKVENITRTAVRYINRIDVPIATTPMVRVEDFLRTYPVIPSNWPYEDLQSYFMQLQIPQVDLGGMIVINQATAPPPNPETTSILLDFDLFRTQYEEPWPADNDAAVWAFLEQLHDRKNEYFEGSITDRTRGLIS